MEKRGSRVPAAGGGRARRSCSLSPRVVTARPGAEEVRRRGDARNARGPRLAGRSFVFNALETETPAHGNGPATLRLTLHSPGSPRRCRRGAPESPRGGARFPPALRSVLNHHGKQKLQQKTFPMGP